MMTRRKRTRSVRWWICTLLFASTAINYLDRQTLALLAPSLKAQFHWTNTDYAHLVIGFRVAYTIGQMGCGRLLDRLGTRLGAILTVSFYSLISILTPMASGFASFFGFRFLLGLGESANWPAATKAVSEWFPGEERGLATAFFDSGSSIGATIAPLLIFWLNARWGWRAAFIVPGCLGFVWLMVWLRFYYPPEKHPLVSAEEMAMIRASKSEEHASEKVEAGFLTLFRIRETWGTIAARALTDPVWFFITDWFPIYLVAKGFSIGDSLFAVWIPFLAADAGSYFGGFVSGYLVRRGWGLLAARRAVALGGGIGTLCLLPTVFCKDIGTITALFAVTTFSYNAFSVMANVLPSDLYQPYAVATMSGVSGTAAGIGTILCFEAIGYLSDSRSAAGTHAFDPILIACGLVPFVGAVLVCALIRDKRSVTPWLKTVS